MDQLGVSAIHPTAPEFLSAVGLFNAPIDLEAAVARLGEFWSRPVEPVWQLVEADPRNPSSPSGSILHFELDGVLVMLTPVNNSMVPERGALPPHRFHVAATFFARATPTPAGEIPEVGHAEIKAREGMVAAHIAMTEVMDCLMREEAAVGVYRAELGVVQPSRMVIELGELLTQGRVPVPLWINVRTAKADLSAGRSLGLPLFGHLDLEVRESVSTEDEVYDLIANAAEYIITGEAYLLPGQTIGFHGQGEIAILQETSPVDGESVIRLAY